MALVDRITILKDGKVVSSASETKMDITSIIEQMVGREIKQHYPKQYNASNENLLEVQGLSSAGGPGVPPAIDVQTLAGHGPA